MLGQPIVRAQPRLPTLMDRHEYFAALNDLPKTLILFLLDFEQIQNDFQPDRLGEYADHLRRHHVDTLANQVTMLQGLVPPDEIQGFHDLLSHGAESAATAARLFTEFGETMDITKALKSWKHLGEAYRVLYVLRGYVPGVRRFWVLPDAFEEIERYDPPLDPDGPGDRGPMLMQANEQRNWYARYVPEWYSPDQAWPVVIALHGGWGRGDTFLWSWVRPAKTRGYIVLSPKSYDTTWTEADLPSVLGMLEETAALFNVDRSRVLLTGLSDGGIYTYLYGLNHPESFTALAALSSNFMPFMIPKEPTTRPVYIMHGEADHMFPVQVARGAAWQLQERAYPVEYHERPGYGHYYPPDENRLILEWFEGHVGPGPQPPAMAASDRAGA